MLFMAFFSNIFSHFISFFIFSIYFFHIFLNIFHISTYLFCLEIKNWIEFKKTVGGSTKGQFPKHRSVARASKPISDGGASDAMEWFLFPSVKFSKQDLAIWYLCFGLLTPMAQIFARYHRHVFFLLSFSCFFLYVYINLISCLWSSFWILLFLNRSSSLFGRIRPVASTRWFFKGCHQVHELRSHTFLTF